MFISRRTARSDNPFRVQLGLSGIASSTTAFTPNVHEWNITSLLVGEVAMLVGSGKKYAAVLFTA
jgi:hypothetical protein